MCELEKKVEVGEKSERNLEDYGSVVERYLKPYFADKNIDNITEADVARYRKWRRDYWVIGPGASITTITYMRNAKEVSRPVSAMYRRALAPGTFYGGNVVLRSMFGHAFTNGWMTAAQIPKIQNAKKTKSDSRDRACRHFVRAEYHKLKRCMTLWVTKNEISEKERWRREAVQDYILILLNSGLRKLELFKKIAPPHPLKLWLHIHGGAS